MQVKLNHDLLLAKKYTAEANAELVKQPLAAAVAKIRAKSPTGDDEVSEQRAYARLP